MAPFQGTQSNHFRRCFIFCVGVAHGKTWEELAESLLETQHFILKSLVKSQIGGNMIQIHTFHRISIGLYEFESFFLF